MKIFFYTLRPWDERPFAERLAAETGIEFDGCEAYPSLENAHLAAGCDAVSMTPCDMGPAMVRRFHELGVKYLCCRSIGYDHVDRETARALGMRVSNVDYPPRGVANFAIMLMLMSLRRVGHILKRGEVQDYSLQGKIGRDLSGCTVGVIGTGHIGRTVLEHLSGFGCRLLAYDLYPSQEAARWAEYVDFDTLCAESDVITLHMPLTAENRHMIDRTAFSKMKRGALLVNTARGGLVNTRDLIRALESEQIGGAGIDTVEEEDNICHVDLRARIVERRDLFYLKQFPNVIYTSHYAFFTEEATSAMVECALTSLAAFRDGKENAYEIK